jgi:hypothetical protein
MGYFLNSNSELRTGWRLAAFVAVLLPVWIAAGLLLTATAFVSFGDLDPFQVIALNVPISFIAAVVATLFATLIVERLSLQPFGIGFHRGWISNVKAGIGIAAGLLVLQLLASIIFGNTTIEWNAHAPLSRFLLTLGVLVVAAAFEELIFRGYPLQALMKGIGPWPAMIAMSCLFGLLHLQNPGSSALSVFNTIVAGMMLSLAYWKTRSLWLSYAIHLGWNVGLGMVLGFSLSGLNVASLWTTRVSGSALLLGGEYGPEGGLLGTLIFLAGAIAVWKIRIRQINYDDRFYKDARPG